MKERAGEGLECTWKGFLVWKCIMQPDDADVFLPRTLLRLDEPGSAVDADNEAAGDFRVQGTRVARLVNAQDAFQPGDDFVG